MTTQKTWLTIHFYHGQASIEATLNYETKSFTLTHGSNDDNVTFNSEGDESDMKTAMDRLKCVSAALQFIKQELNL